MPNATPFKFKEFSVNQSNSAMKIGTDAVLLGAWVSLKQQPFSILDIGAGTGVLALMLAQRSSAEVIDALEIDAPAYEECVENFEHSPWGDRLFCYHATLEEFFEEIDDVYDMIVCNPPFYAETYKTDNSQRDLARFQDAMPFEHLVESAAKLLSEQGSFSVVIPHKEETHFSTLAKAHGLYPNAILHVKGHPEAPVKRSLITYSRKPSETAYSSLTIELERHVYTEDYINLTKAFYINM